MKKKLLSFILTVVMIASMIPASVLPAYAESSDFVIDENGVLTAYNGEGGDVVVPDGVVSIGEGVFANSSDLTGIELPDSVISIRDFAFASCSNLESVAFSDSLESIGISAFINCYGLTSIEIPDSVTSIGNYAFAGCDNIESIILSKSLTTISDCSFNDNRALKTLELPEGLKIIGPHAFAGCNTLASINLPDSLETIGQNAFGTCYGFTSIVIPESVKSIGYGAFNWCENLTSVTFEGQPDEIGDTAFRDVGLVEDCTLTLPDSWIGEPTAKTDISWLDGYFNPTADARTYIERSWDEANGKVIEKVKRIVNAETIESDKKLYINAGSTYVVDGNVSCDYLGIRGTSDKPTLIILKDDSSLTITTSLSFYESGQLKICGQAGDSGKLILDCEASASQDGDATSTITVCGGDITASSKDSAGINYPVTVYGGRVTATGGKTSSQGKAGISGAVTVYGGSVTATGGVVNRRPVGEGIRGTLSAYGDYVIKAGDAAPGTEITLEDYNELKFSERVYVNIHYHDYDAVGNCKICGAGKAANQKFVLHDITNDLFLTGGDEWGTQLVGDKHGKIMKFDPADGGYALATGFDNGNNSQYLSEAGWCDGSFNDAVKFEFVTSENGFYLKKHGSDLYLTKGDVPSGFTKPTYSFVQTDTPTEWELLSREDIIARSDDFTPLISDANMSRNDTGFTGWSGTYNIGKVPPTGDSGTILHNTFGEFWSEFGGGNFNMYQTVEDIPNGKYILKAQGFYRCSTFDDAVTEYANGTGDELVSYLYVSSGTVEEKIKLNSIASENFYSGGSDDQLCAVAAFTAGKYQNELEIEVTDGTLTIGVKSDGYINPGAWATFDNFELYYIPSPSHEHVFSTEWTNNETAHWHVCTADGCDIADYSTCGLEGAAYAAHTFTGDLINYEGNKWAKKCVCGAYDTANTKTGVTVPTAKTGLVYNGETQTGVEEGEGYTLTGNTATDAGTYTAIATLADGYVWEDETFDGKIEWRIISREEDKLINKTSETDSLMARQGKIINGKVSNTVGRTIIPLTQAQLDSINNCIWVVGFDGNKDFKVQIDCAYTWFYNDGEKIEAGKTPGLEDYAAFIIIDNDGTQNDDNTITGFGYYRVYKDEVVEDDHFMLDALYAAPEAD